MQVEQERDNRYDKELCLREIEADIQKECQNRGVVVVCFGGPSAGGKSGIAEELAGSHKNISVVHMDDYMAGEMLPFKPPPHPDRPFLAGINPDVFDLERMQDDLRKL